MRSAAAPAVLAVLVFACAEDERLLPEGENACDSESGLRGAGPHICPDQSPVAYCERLVAAGPHTTDLVLSNRGNERVEISDVRLLGDARCSFRTPEIDVMEIEPGFGAALVRIDYAPQTAGEDHVTLEIDSNAVNFATLRVAICGRALDDASDASGCPDCQEPESADPACAPEP